MNRRSLIICAALALAMMAGGIAATVTLLLSLHEANQPLYRAPSSDLERSLQMVLGSMDRTLADISRRAESLDALGGLLVDAGVRQERSSLVSVQKNGDRAR